MELVNAHDPEPILPHDSLNAYRGRIGALVLWGGYTTAVRLCQLAIPLPSRRCPMARSPFPLNPISYYQVMNSWHAIVVSVLWGAEMDVVYK